MSGKAYTMQEMRSIVEYLTEHRAYGEVKGRKLWMDYASSKLTNRTWQSLKETFLKRILPDIHNPYYKLSTYQIASFRGGQDVEEKLKNKLEIREVTADTSKGNLEKDEHASSSKETNGEVKGEDPIDSKVDRDSTETIVLNNCYDSAEDIKRDITTPTDETEDYTKKLRDLIEFEPMTPDAQRVIEDFDTDGEGSDGEPRMEIDLKEREVNSTNTDEAPILLSDSDKQDTTKSGDNDIQTDKQSAENKSKNDPQVAKPQNEDISQKENHSQVSNNDEAVGESKNIERDTVEAVIEGSTKANVINENSKSTLNTSDTIALTNSTIPDSILPNNQEELKKDDMKNKSKPLSLSKKGNEKRTPLKRKNPVEVQSDDNKQPKMSKTKSDKEKTHTNTETVVVHSDDNEQPKMSKAEPDKEKTHTNTETVVNVSDSGEIEQDKEINKNVTRDNNKLSQSSENPCLQSVSLYDAQLAETKNSETERSFDLIQELVKNPDKTRSAGKVIREKNKNDVVVLKSHSDSITSNTESSDRGHIITKRSRDNALANVFGFTSGPVRSKNSYRKRSLSHQQSIDVDSESSNWTSDSASEYVSPPRGRRSRQIKKFLKPKSARMTSLEKNGGLFVVYNNKIYPVVKDGKIVKNHVNYISDDDSDEDRNSWKLKYLEEKKKSAELQKLLHHVKEKNQIEHCRTSEPVCSARCDALVKGSHGTCQIHESKSSGRRKQETDQEEKPVKIKFTKNNEEVQLEGPLSYITPALAQVMQLFHKTELQQKTKRNTRVPAIVSESGTSSSLTAVNLDDEVQEKVNKIEDEIFKEIEEQDKIDNTGADMQDNVTKRNRLRRKTSTTSARNSKSPAKKPRVEQKEDNTQKRREQDVTTSEDMEGETSVKTTRQTRTSIKEANKSEANTRTRRSLSRKQAEPKTEVEPTKAKVEEDSDIRYKFPSPLPSDKKAQARNKKTPQTKLNSTTVKTLTLPYNLSYSSESMQGYQDSDISPDKICLKRRRPSYSTTRHNKIKNTYANKKSTSVTQVPFDVYESSNSFQDIKQSITFHNSTLATEIYKSDSYQLLMPIDVPTSKKNAIHTIGFRNIAGDPNLESRCTSNKRITPNSDNPNAEGFSSSNVSLPTSPVLSIVENISISRSLLTSVDDLPADDQDPVEIYKSNQITLNNLMTSDLDAPMPLMEQECKIHVEHDDGINYHYNMQVQNTLTPSSQSLINKLNTVNIEDQSLSQSVNTRLNNLIIDSNKKTKDKLTKRNKQADNENNINEDTNIQKGKTKKRSSTPRRRPTTRKVTNSIREPLIEEEYMETCSCASRRSCPAVLSTNEPVATVDTKKDKQTNTKIAKDKNKKDIIKVKIIKPKDKPNAKSNYKIRNTSCNNLVVNGSKTDLLQQTDNSIDLIHNHSDTCLQANECIGDSVEIIENSCSVVSVNSERSGKSCNLPMLNMDGKIAEELYSTNARDGIEQDTQMETFIEAECPETFHTPPGPISSAASLMTEDLSVEIPETTPPRCTKWWLLSEDEYSNSNNIDVNQNVITKDVGYGADLNVLFPVTCAVPDLSTITEFSKENDVDTRSNLNSPLPNV